MLLPLLLLASFAAAAEPIIDFGRDIQPILSDRCYKCHGPDEAKREAELRFDIKESVFAERDGKRAIVPGDPAASELIKRIVTDDPELHMPPRDSKLTLSPREVELLKNWIAQGAKWGGHWAFVTPVRPNLPGITNVSWPRNAIDPFVLERLEQEGLSPSPEANRTTLIRRVTLDLTALPPTPEEVADFVADKSPDAYERLVDRLLASPRYGEQMALPWLDAARYADTSGYQNDGPRHMWRWRDWVIDALNANMPFDQFTIEQLAGDLLPSATLEQRIASGFNRNHRGNSEGGIIAAEYEVEYVVDRVDTTATVWMGLTLGCTRCHDHKYDPFTQEEFYKLYAYFNSIPEQGRATKEGNSPPYISAPTREQQVQLDRALERSRAARQALDDAEGEISLAQAAWEQSVAGRPVADWTVEEGLVASVPLDDKAVVRDGKAEFVAGPRGKAMQFDGGAFVDAGDVGNFGYFDKFTLAAWIKIDKGGGGTIFSRMTDEAEGDGYSVVVRDGKVQVFLVKRWLDDAIRTETEAVIEPGKWHHVMVRYDGSRSFLGVRVFVDGRTRGMHGQLDALNQTFASKEPFRIGAGGGPEARFRGSIGDVRIYNRAVDSRDIASLSVPNSIAEILAKPQPRRSQHERYKLRDCFLSEHATEKLHGLYVQANETDRQYANLKETIPDVMVMEELSKPRPAHVLIRGQYDQPGKPVERGVPKALRFEPQLQQGEPPGGEDPFGVSPPPHRRLTAETRLSLAQWLVDPGHPLTARVAVNRQWQTFFGAGLVRTPEDFGTQGQRPTHPALLDWLATELISSGWDVKRLHRLIVTSATYRQSSHVSAQLAVRDPDNRLLARGPRQRLSAQALRDQALFASGLLVENLGGPSVKPYQPPGLWEELANQTYEQGHGADLYRRSLYTYWKRTAASPSMMTFDASDRETCTVRRSRTNTPLQALTLLNEVTFVEAARVLAERVLVGQASPLGSNDSDRLTLMFELATSRRPSSRELGILQQSLAFHRASFAKHPETVDKLLDVGEAERSASLDKAEIAAYAAVANLVLNLDEVITKE